MRVVVKQSLVDRITTTIEALQAEGHAVSHIELTEREMQQLRHECGGAFFASDGVHETRFCGHRVVIV